MGGGWFSWGVSTDPGNRRARNEDYAAIMAVPWGHDQGAAERVVVIAAIADGAGGHLLGHRASRAAVSAFLAEFVRFLGTAGPLEARGSMQEAIERGFGAADKAVREVAPSNGGTSATTLSVAVIAGSRLWIGHVGDTRIFLVRNRHVHQLTRDHTVAQAKIDAGLISADAARGSAEASQLVQALGFGSRPQPDIACFSLTDGDVVFLTTDGAHNSLGETDLLESIRACASAQDGCTTLVRRALERDGSDNITIVRLDVGRPPRLPRRIYGGRRPISKRQIALGVSLGAVLVLMALVVAQISSTTPVRPSDIPLPHRRASKVSAPSPSPYWLQLRLRARGRGVSLNWQAQTAVRLSVAGEAISAAEAKHRGQAAVRLDRAHAALPAQEIELRVVQTKPGAARWLLKREPRKAQAPSRRGLWINNKKQKWRNLAEGWSSGTFAMPVRSLKFYLDGRPPVPVVVRFEDAEAALPSTAPSADEADAVGSDNGGRARGSNR